MLFEKSIIEKVNIPNSNSKVYKSECALSFDTPDSENGIYICLNKFLAFGHNYVNLYSKATGFKIFLNIKRIRHEIQNEGDEEPQVKKPTKLAIGIEGGFTDAKKYDAENIFNIYILPEQSLIPITDPNLPEIVQLSVAAIISADSADKQMEIDALQNTWDGEKRNISKHADQLKQLDNGVKVGPSGWKCEKCDLVDNLWMNLTDGTILCGRKFFDGSGGNNHASEYYSATGYPLAVKLGTISPNSADVYSYEEDEMVEDPKLSEHLAHFGIDIMKLEKTEKTMIEMELELNQRSWESLAIEESGSELKCLFGAEHTGMHNLGNTCYMNSVIQMLFSTPIFQNYYLKTPKEIFENAPEDPNVDFLSQMRKLALGLASGEYSKENIEEKNKIRNGIRPTFLKRIVGNGHLEFSTNKQQDAAEYLQHFFTIIERNSVGQMTPLDSFKFEVEDRLECNATQQVKYLTRIENILSMSIPLDQATNKEELDLYKIKTLEAEKAGIKLDGSEAVRPNIKFDSCLKSFLSSSIVEDFYSSAIKSKTSATKSIRLRSFPDYLLIQLQKFEIGSDWVERKLDVCVDMPLEVDLSCMKGFGLQPDEILLNDSTNPEAEEMEEAMEMDGEMLSSLMSMGFGIEGCQKALNNTKGQGMESAVNWIMEHMSDPDFNEPVARKCQNSVIVADALLEAITSMGFSRSHAIAALQSTGNNLERAMDWIFSHPETDAAFASENSHQSNKLTDGSTKYKLTAFISHMGSSTKCGHYVCHVRKGDGWVIYNDEKVAQSLQPPIQLAFIYLYTRI